MTSKEKRNNLPSLEEIIRINKEKEKNIETIADRIKKLWEFSRTTYPIDFEEIGAIIKKSTNKIEITTEFPKYLNKEYYSEYKKERYIMRDGSEVIMEFKKLKGTGYTDNWSLNFLRREYLKFTLLENIKGKWNVSDDISISCSNHIDDAKRFLKKYLGKPNWNIPINDANLILNNSKNKNFSHYEIARLWENIIKNTTYIDPKDDSRIYYIKLDFNNNLIAYSY